ncbi:MAG: oxygen-independent coproporphyrinogen III oxidase [Bacteroidales bacterium]|nr:oxygen-independent coproporphyrinogen III oxidase [Bacteroidales bacterium]
MDKKIIERYDKPGPRYTSYPPASLFKEGFTEKAYTEAIVLSNRDGHPGISLYVHVPFCPRLCHFCGCNTTLGKDRGFIARYFDALLEEIDRVAGYLDRKRMVTQIHWGGGTPNSVEWSLIEKVMDRFRSHFRMAEDAEVAMECSPAYLGLSDIDRLNDMGFNRISLGIQDFNESVLDIINRAPSRLPVEELVGYIRLKSKARVNLDFVYGLPGQSLQGYLETLKRGASIRPDRMVTFSYAHVPWVKKNQKILERSHIPGPEIKLEMLLQGCEYLTSAAYDPIGMDHFALPGDEMAKAYRDKTLHRNFQGYCTKRHTGQVYAFGASSISQLENAYIQNTKEPAAYVERIESGALASERGYLLNPRERIIRNVINQLMCNGMVDFKEEAKKHGMLPAELESMLQYSREKFQKLEQDGLLVNGQGRIESTRLGMLLIRVIARELDPDFASYQTVFSKTI